MAKVTEKLARKGAGPFFICDFSPPRGAESGWLEDAKHLDADFICVAYNPGKSVRLDSAIAAYLLKERCQKEVIFNLASRDMNKLAMQTHLLGASALGLENVVVLKGDDFKQEELAQTGAAGGFKPTSLIGAIKDMNQGIDYRGRKLSQPTSYCVGGVADLSKGIEAEARLTRSKVQAGADFLLTQPIYDSHLATRFLEAYHSDPDGAPDLPIFFGVQVLLKDGVLFSDVPQNIRDDLEEGRSGADIAIEAIRRLRDSGLDTVYLVAPIIKGGARDYEAAQQVIAAFR